jgi:hypothetical protein
MSFDEAWGMLNSWQIASTPLESNATSRLRIGGRAHGPVIIKAVAAPRFSFSDDFGEESVDLTGATVVVVGSPSRTLDITLSRGLELVFIEEILAAANLGTSDTAGYLNVAAQVRSNEELIAALSKASTDSANVACRIFWLTLVLAIAAFLQAIATVWPYLSWWWRHL